MKPPVKTLASITIILLSLTSVHAQLKLNSASSVAADIRKVIDDYPSHFENILGEMIVQNPQSTDYQCNFKVNGAEECTITRYAGKKNFISSWQATMLTSESFDEAKKKFKAIYNQVNNLSIKAMHLQGAYETPVEEKRFSSVVFSFNTNDELMKKLRVELTLQAEGMDWRVRLLVYDLDKNDDEPQ